MDKVSWNREGTWGTTESSELGWGPGVWPAEWTFASPTGEPVKFARCIGCRSEGEEVSKVRYHAVEKDLTITVWND